MRVEPARPADVDGIARLHAESIHEGFLSSLGPAFLALLYRSMVHSPDVTLLVARREGAPVGFVAGAAQPGAFYRRFLRRKAFRAGALVARRALRPDVARRLVETALHVRRSGGRPSAELLAIAVAPQARRHGAGAKLVRALEDDLVTPDVGAIEVVVAAGNEAARAFYERLGYKDPTPLEVHRGEPSVRYRKRLTPRPAG
jgi:ribosomal protein S18 acetylase RimI-like enzyme